MTRRGRRLGLAICICAYLVPLPADARNVPSCGARSATIIGTNKGELIIGTSGSDVIVALGGRDEIHGRAGDDIICAGSGADDVLAGRGQDVVYGGDGNDDRDDFVQGGKGADLVYAESGRDFIRGGSGNDRLYLGEGPDVANGGQGNDRVHGGNGADDIGGGGLQRITIDGFTYAIVKRLGEAGRDRHYGGPGRDFFAVGSGQDRIAGGPGRDWASLIARDRFRSFLASLSSGHSSGAESGSDSLQGIEDLSAYGPGDITLIGDRGVNRLIGSSSSASGTTVLKGRGENDLLRIFPGFRMSSSGRARLMGGPGADRLDAGCESTQDVLRAGRGGDILSGCDGPESMFGGRGQDSLRDSADDSSDLLDGGPGFDFASYLREDGRVVADLNMGSATICTTSCGPSSTLSWIEGLEGTRGGDDSLTGDSTQNKLVGSGGNDILSGLDGDDELFGGQDDDSLDGGEGTNRNNGGRGTDFCINPDRAQSATRCEAP